jgi:hypothetical protein
MDAAEITKFLQHNRSRVVRATNGRIYELERMADGEWTTISRLDAKAAKAACARLVMHMGNRIIFWTWGNDDGYHNG